MPQPTVAALESLRSVAVRFFGPVEPVVVTDPAAARDTVLDHLGLGPDDEVLVPVVGPAELAAALAHRGVAVVPVDVDPVTGIVTPDLAAAARTPRSRALVVTGHGGIVPDRWALQAALPGVVVVEDATATFGGRRAGRWAGRPPAWTALRVDDRPVGLALLPEGATVGRGEDDPQLLEAVQAVLARLPAVAAERRVRVARLRGGITRASGLRLLDERPASTRGGPDVVLDADPGRFPGGAAALEEALLAEGLPAHRPSLIELDARRFPGASQFRDRAVLLSGVGDQHPAVLDRWATVVRRAATRPAPQRPGPAPASRRLRVAVVGDGPEAHAAVAAVLAEPDRLVLSAVVGSAAAAFGGVEVPRTDELLPGQADVAVLALPAAARAAAAERALRAGMHVIGSLPLGVDPDEVRGLMSRAARSGRTLVPLAPWRAADDVRRVRSLTRAGTLGVLQELLVHVSDPATEPHGRPAGVVAELGPMAADLVSFLAGPIRSVLATDLAHDPERADTVATLHLRLTDTATATVLLGHAAGRRSDTWAEVVGDEAAVSLGWTRTTFRRPGGGPGIELGTGYAPRAALAESVKAALVALATGRPTDTGPADVLATVAVVEAAQRSMRRAAWEDVTTAPVIDLREPANAGVLSPR